MTLPSPAGRKVLTWRRNRMSTLLGSRHLLHARLRAAFRRSEICKEEAATQLLWGAPVEIGSSMSAVCQP